MHGIKVCRNGETENYLFSRIDIDQIDVSYTMKNTLTRTTCTDPSANYSFRHRFPIVSKVKYNPGYHTEMQQNHCPESATERRDRYKSKLFACAVFEICFGLASLAMGIATLFIDKKPWRHPYWYNANAEQFTERAQGVWAGAVICVSGIFGIVGRTRPTASMYKKNMTVSMLAAIIGSMGCAFTINAMGDLRIQKLLSVHAGVLLSLLGGILSSMVHSAYCCAGNCTQNHQPQEGAVRTSDPRDHGEQVIRLPPGQYMITQTDVRTNIATVDSLIYSNDREQIVASPAGNRPFQWTAFSKLPSYKDATGAVPPSYDSLQI